MTYLTKNKARTTHTTTLTGEPASQYSRYETGVITGNYRDLPAIIADSSFDSINDGERWQVMNVFKGNNSYLDTVAIGGAMDADHAMQVMSTQLDSMGADYAKLVMLDSGSQFDSTSGGDAIEDWSLDAIGKLMNNPSQDKHYLPVITAKELDIETHRVTFDSVQWGGSDSFTLKSHGGKDSNLYLDMVRHDSRHELVNALDIASELQALGAEEDSFDALMEVKSRLPLLKNRLFNAMSRSSIDDLSVTNMTETKPFKRQGVSNIAFVFDLSDGQKVSIWFHNPDSTPAKLMPSDIMISWKWMLNKRDVTAALSPKNGDNVQLPALAKRMMRVAAKNSARFKSAQARKIQVDEELNQAQKDFEEKTAIVIGLDEKIESLNKKIEDATKAPVDKSRTTTETEANGKIRTTVYGSDGNIKSMSTDMLQMIKPADSVKLPQGVYSSSKKTKVYPPVEVDSEGNYIAYMNNKKSDSWTAIPNDDGSFVVYADNAMTRAGTGRGLPKYFDNVTKLTERYPAFIGIETLIAGSKKPSFIDIINDYDAEPVSADEMSAAEIDAIELEAFKAFKISDDFWNKPTSVIQALSDDDFNRLLESLEDVSKVATSSDDTDYRSETTLFKAKRTGNATLIEDASAALNVSDGQFSELPEVKKERDELAAKVDTTNKEGDTPSREPEFINDSFAQSPIKNYKGIRYQVSDSGAFRVQKKSKDGSYNGSYWTIVTNSNGSYSLYTYDALVGVLGTINPKFFDSEEDMFSAPKMSKASVQIKPILDMLSDTGTDNASTTATQSAEDTSMDVFKAGDNVVWRSQGSEISRGVFSKYIGEGAERRGIFVDDGGNMNAPASELFFDESVGMTPEQQEALALSNTYNEVEVVIESLSSGARKFNEWSMTKDSVAALPNEQFLRLSDKLARVRMYSAEQLLNAYRTGRDDLIGMAQTIKDNEASAGETTPEINKRRDNLWKVIQAELNLTVPTGDRAAIQPMASSKRVIEGKTNNAKTPKGTKIASKFALVDAKYVIASHNATGSKNPKYPQELQPRDRGRETSIAWVQKTAKELDPESLGRTSRVDTGAPIVGDDLVVESGNGRTMAIKLAYKEGNAEDYREWLMENSDMFGFTANQVAKFKEPILVRIRTSEISREAFAVEANQDDKLSFTASELAKSDAKRITDGMLELFTPSDNGDLLSASNQPFVRAFLGSLGATEAAQYSDSNGQPTQALAARMKAAVFSKAYNDDRLLEMMADQTNPESQNMINALSMAAGKFVEAQANSRSQSLDISDGIINAVEQSLNDKVKSAIVDASNILSNAKRNNQDVAEYVTQMGLFEDVDPATAELAVFLANNSRSAKKMAEYFKAMAGFVDQQAKHSQTLDMFGDPEPLSLSDVMNHAKAVTSGNDLFSEDNMPAAQPEPIKNEPNTTFSERISEIESIVNGGDFNPADVSTDELDQIAIAVKDDAELINRVQVIMENYVKAMARVAIAGMTKLAGGM